MGLIVVMKGQERTPRYRCIACDTVFYDGEETLYERHVVKCSETHDEALRAESPRTQMPGICDPFKSGDVELERWISANRDLLLEDRKKL